MQAIGYRRFLPAFVLLTIAALLLIQMLERRVRTQPVLNLPHQPASAMVSDPIISSYDLPMPVGVVSALAAPGLLPFMLLGYGPMGASLATPAFLGIIGMVTVLVWYAAGRWIDRRLGHIPRRPPMPGLVQQLLNWALLAAWIVAVSTLTRELIAIDFMDVMHWIGAGIACWGGFVSIVLICRIRDQRRLTRQLAPRAAERVGV
jgi:hypothetical protein